MRVLVADDQKGVGTSIADLVRACNHEVVEVVGSGFDAIQAYQRHRPDLVLLDYYMPRLNGGTACRNIVARDATARVVIMSGAARTDLSHVGAVAVLSKPVDLDQLNAVLNDTARLR